MLSQGKLKVILQLVLVTVEDPQGEAGESTVEDPRGEVGECEEGEETGETSQVKITRSPYSPSLTWYDDWSVYCRFQNPGPEVTCNCGGPARL